MAQIRQEDGRWIVTGPMTMKQVNALLSESSALPPANEIDLSEVSDVDTSAVSLLFEWMRQAQGRNSKISIVNLPANLVSLAELYGVTDLLPKTPSN